jgi:hypothetical protein
MSQYYQCLKRSEILLHGNVPTGTVRISAAYTALQKLKAPFFSLHEFPFYIFRSFLSSHAPGFENKFLYALFCNTVATLSSAKV